MKLEYKTFTKFVYRVTAEGLKLDIETFNALKSTLPTGTVEYLSPKFSGVGYKEQDAIQAENYDRIRGRELNVWTYPDEVEPFAVMLIEGDVYLRTDVFDTLSRRLGNAMKSHHERLHQEARKAQEKADAYGAFLEDYRDKFRMKKRHKTEEEKR